MRPVLSALVSLVVLASTLFPSAASAAPVTSPLKKPWLVLLCKYADVAREPVPRTYFETLFTRSTEASDAPGTGTLFDYWRDVSDGQINLTGSVVSNWYSLPWPYAQEFEHARQPDWQANDCVLNSPYQTSTLEKFNIVVVMNAWTPSGAVPATLSDGTSTWRVLTNPDGYGVGFLAREMGRVYGLRYARDRRLGCEYCDHWDIMGDGWGYPGTYGYAGSTWPGAFTAGPGMSAPDLFNLGLLNMAVSPLSYYPDEPATRLPSRTITLTAMNDPRRVRVPAFVAARIPFTRNNSQHVYTVEYRQKFGWDRGLQNVVLIHDMDLSNGLVYLVDDQANAWGNDGAWGPGMTFSDPTLGLRITTESIDPTRGTATITIRHDVGPYGATSSRPMGVMASALNASVTVDGSNLTPNGLVKVDLYGRNSYLEPLTHLRTALVTASGTCGSPLDGFCVNGGFHLLMSQGTNPCYPSPLGPIAAPSYSLLSVQVWDLSAGNTFATFMSVPLSCSPAAH